MPRAIVKRRIGQLAKYGGYAMYASPYKRARMAGTVARYAVKYGPKAYRGARKIASWYKKRKARTKIGERVGTSNAKRTVELQTNIINGDSRTLYTTHLTSCNYGDDTNQRERNVVNFKGFKLCMMHRNQTAVPIYFNMAVISRKGGDMALTPNATDFFRAHNVNRSKDFNDNLTAMEFHCSPINTDMYTVLKHKRYIMAPKNNSSVNWQSRVGQSWRNVDWYVKLNRQLRFDTNADTVPQSGACWLVYWCDTLEANSTSTAVSAALGSQFYLVTYWRPTCAC